MTYQNCLHYFESDSSLKYTQNVDNIIIVPKMAKKSPMGELGQFVQVGLGNAYEILCISAHTN